MLHKLSLQIKINATGSVEDLVKETSKVFKNLIYHPYEYALQVVRDNENIWLTRRAPLCEQVSFIPFVLDIFSPHAFVLQLLSSDEHVILRRYVFLSDSLVDYSKQTFVLDFLYLECRKSHFFKVKLRPQILQSFLSWLLWLSGMVTGKHPVNLQQAVQFAALQMQAQYVFLWCRSASTSPHFFAS